jgi:hypothetical protein
VRRQENETVKGRRQEQGRIIENELVKERRQEEGCTIENETVKGRRQEQGCIIETETVSKGGGRNKGKILRKLEYCKKERKGLEKGRIQG